MLADLPEKTIIPRNIDLDGAQRELYESLRLAQHERVLAEVRQRGLAQSGIIVIDALLKLRQVCCDPRLLKNNDGHGAPSAKFELLMEMLPAMVEKTVVRPINPLAAEMRLSSTISGMLPSFAGPKSAACAPASPKTNSISQICPTRMATIASAMMRPSPTLQRTITCRLL